MQSFGRLIQVVHLLEKAVQEVPPQDPSGPSVMMKTGIQTTCSRQVAILMNFFAQALFAAYLPSPCSLCMEGASSKSSRFAGQSAESLAYWEAAPLRGRSDAFSSSCSAGPLPSPRCVSFCSSWGWSSKVPPYPLLLLSPSYLQQSFRGTPSKELLPLSLILTEAASHLQAAASFTVGNLTIFPGPGRPIV